MYQSLLPTVLTSETLIMHKIWVIFHLLSGQRRILILHQKKLTYKKTPPYVQTGETFGYNFLKP